MTTPIVLPITGSVSASLFADLEKLALKFGVIEKASVESAAKTGRAWQLSETLIKHATETGKEAIQELKEKGAEFAREFGDSFGQGFGDIAEVAVKTVGAFGPVGAAIGVTVGVLGLAANAVREYDRQLAVAEARVRGNAALAGAMKDTNEQLGDSYRSVAAAIDATKTAEENVSAVRAAGLEVLTQQLELLRQGNTLAQAQQMTAALDAQRAAQVAATGAAGAWTIAQRQAAIASGNTAEQLLILGSSMEHSADATTERARQALLAVQATASSSEAEAEHARVVEREADALHRRLQAQYAAVPAYQRTEEMLRGVLRSEDALTVATRSRTTAEAAATERSREAHTALLAAKTATEEASGEITKEADALKRASDARQRATDTTRALFGAASEMSAGVKRAQINVETHAGALRALGVTEQEITEKTTALAHATADHAAALSRVSTETGTLSELEKALANGRQRDAEKVRRMAAGAGPTAAETRASIEALRAARAANDNMADAEQAALSLAFASRELAIAQTHVDHATRAASAATYDEAHHLVSRAHPAHVASLAQRNALTSALAAQTAAQTALNTAVESETAAMRGKADQLREQALARLMVVDAERQSLDQLMSARRDPNAGAYTAGGLDESEADRAHRAAMDAAGAAAQAADDQRAMAEMEDANLRASIERHESYAGRLAELNSERVHGSQRAAEFTNSAFDSMGKAIGTHVQALVEGKETVGVALQGMLSDTLISVGKEAVVQGGMEMAKGLAALAGVVTAPLAPGHFAAGAAFLAVGAAAGVAGAALAPAAAAPSTGAGAGGDRAGGMLNDRPANEGASNAPIQINYYAPVIGGREATEVELGQRLDRYGDAAGALRRRAA